MIQLIHTGTRDGIWEGLLTTRDGTAPQLRITHRGKSVRDISISDLAGTPGQWRLRFQIPSACLSDGIETILITDAQSEEEIGSYTIRSGDAARTDMQAELNLLRAELDMLKRAFRRHCRETTL